MRDDPACPDWPLDPTEPVTPSVCRIRKAGRGQRCGSDLSLTVSLVAARWNERPPSPAVGMVIFFAHLDLALPVGVISVICLALFCTT
jgi:hypothetical protein